MDRLKASSGRNTGKLQMTQIFYTASKTMSDFAELDMLIDSDSIILFITEYRCVMATKY